LPNLIEKEEYLSNNYKDIIENNKQNNTDNKQNNTDNKQNNTDNLEKQTENQSIKPKEHSNFVIESNSYKNDIVLYEKNLISYLIKYEQLFEEYISNKVVALVGPAQSILLSTNGEIIDKFQIVVRLNKSIPLPAHLAPHIGTRSIAFQGWRTTACMQTKAAKANSFQYTVAINWTGWMLWTIDLFPVRLRFAGNVLEEPIMGFG
jgi:hypothetical protein